MLSMAGMSRTLRALAALSIFAIVLTGCSKKNNTKPSELPAGAQLMADGAKAMGEVKTVHFTIAVSGKINGVSIQGAEGDLTREGSAKGTAKLEQFGLVVETAFILIDQSLYVKGPTGGYQKLPLAMVATIYDPSAILDPERGAPRLLKTAKNPQTVGKEQVNGADAYKVTFEPDASALAALIPNNATGVTGVAWLDVKTKRIAKAEFKFPASNGNPEGTVTVNFTNYDAPVSISAP
jgi:lipoprotein LprG